ncbi:MAG: transcriptional regulator [Clostridia bacterium]|nr:transcriptional regulator [Clostridia bacterium]
MALSKDFQNRFKELADELAQGSKSKRAKIIGISNTTYSNAYNYGIIPKTSSLIRIADYFDVSIEYLIANTDDEHFDKSPNPTPFKERLAKLQKDKDISTVYELSQLLHIHRNNIAQWNNLGCIPLIDDLTIIADFFNVSIDYLLGRTDDSTSYK